MYQHPNARLTPLGRRTLWERVESGEGVSSVARDMGVSRRTASKWVGRARRGEGLGDRASRPRRSPTRVPDDERAAVVARRLEPGCSALALSAVTGIPTRTCGRIVAQAGCPPLSAYDPVSGALGRTGPVTRVRYEREAPGDLVHVDVKKLVRCVWSSISFTEGQIRFSLEVVDFLHGWSRHSLGGSRPYEIRRRCPRPLLVFHPSSSREQLVG